MRIFLFRHGAVEDTGERIYLGRTDVPLSEEGCRQAEIWRDYFSKRLSNRIVSSPLQRASEFARIIAGGRDIAIVDDLCEIDLGEWDGRPMAEIRRQDPESWRARGEAIAEFRPPGGESYRDLADRVIPAFERLVLNASADLLIVAHAGVNRVLLAHILGMPLDCLFRIAQAHGALNRIQWRDGVFQVQSINERPAERDQQL